MHIFLSGSYCFSFIYILMFDDIGIADEVDIESYCQMKTILKPSYCNLAVLFKL